MQIIGDVARLFPGFLDAGGGAAMKSARVSGLMVSVATT
jgi:hypothetical protein